MLSDFLIHYTLTRFLAIFHTVVECQHLVVDLWV